MTQKFTSFTGVPLLTPKTADFYAYMANYNKTPAGKVTARRKALRYRGTYLEAYKELLGAQNGRCAICGELPKTNRSLNLDHDHKCCPAGNKTCGKCNRGLLCFNCNTAIGSLKESPEIFDKAKEYLRLEGTHKNYNNLTERSETRTTLYALQQGKCAICNTESKLQLDHNHLTSEIRGLICIGCNTAIGKLRESSDLLDKAKEYLKNYGSI